MFQTWAVEQGEVTWGDCALRTDLGQRWCARFGLHVIDVVDGVVVDGDFCA